MNWKLTTWAAEVLSRLRSIAIDDMDRLSALMNKTVLAAAPQDIPFNAPAAPPAAVEPFLGWPDFLPEDDLSGGPQFAVNYDALWHPRLEDYRYDFHTTDKLSNLWLTQFASRAVVDLERMRDDLRSTYVDARNKGVLYQLSQEQEVLYEPEGDRRTQALARTTNAFHVHDF